MHFALENSLLLKPMLLYLCLETTMQTAGILFKDTIFNNEFGNFKCNTCKCQINTRFSLTFTLRRLSASGIALTHFHDDTGSILANRNQRININSQNKVAFTVELQSLVNAYDRLPDVYYYSLTGAPRYDTVWMACARLE